LRLARQDLTQAVCDALVACQNPWPVDCSPGRYKIYDIAGWGDFPKPNNRNLSNFEAFEKPPEKKILPTFERTPGKVPGKNLFFGKFFLNRLH